MWHRKDKVALDKSAAQPQFKQTLYIMHLHFERNSPHISMFAHAQTRHWAIPEQINGRQRHLF